MHLLAEKEWWLENLDGRICIGTDLAVPIAASQHFSQPVAL